MIVVLWRLPYRRPHHGHPTSVMAAIWPRRVTPALGRHRKALKPSVSLKTHQTFGPENRRASNIRFEGPPPSEATPLPRRYVIEVHRARGRQANLLPSRALSVLNPRIVRVTGATTISFRLSMTLSRVSTKNRSAFIAKSKCVPADHRESTELIPPIRFPCDPLVFARKLVAGRGRQPVSRCIRAVGRRNPPE